MRNAKTFFGIVIFLLAFTLFANACHWFGGAEEVAQKEFGAKAMLEKYEWFINQSAFIDKMDQDIENLNRKKAEVFTQYQADYGANKDKWDMIVLNSYQKEISLNREQLNSTVAQRNSLVAEYNAQSRKFNWQPFNKDKRLPPKSYNSL